MATGWLGWSPQEAWHTPLPELFLTLDAKIEWTRMSNPFGGGRATAPEKPKPTTIAQKIRAALTGKIERGE